MSSSRAADPGNLPDSGVEPASPPSPALQVDSVLPVRRGSPLASVTSTFPCVSSALSVAAASSIFHLWVASLSCVLACPFFHHLHHLFLYYIPFV